MKEYFHQQRRSLIRSLQGQIGKFQWHGKKYLQQCKKMLKEISVAAKEQKTTNMNVKNRIQMDVLEVGETKCKTWKRLRNSAYFKHSLESVLPVC